MQKFDFLVVGGGLAGLFFALKVAGEDSTNGNTVAILIKKEAGLCASAWAQGGIAAVTNSDDSPKIHLEDTLKVGDGLNNKRIVDIVVKEGPSRVKELINFGVKFDKEKHSNSYHLHKEAGHSKRRIYHSGDSTGLTIYQTLLKKVKKHKNITIFEDYTAVDLITSAKVNGHKKKTSQKRSHKLNAYGLYALNPHGQIETFSAKKIILATGGAGKIYLYTSNPDTATGDGIAIAHRAGAKISNMEFFQFHPTCLFHVEAKTFLITEAMRGEGAILYNKKIERFMKKYHKDLELAPRDIVARAIDNELKVSGDECVYLDISHKKSAFIKEHFPNIYKKCLSYGIDITREPIPIVPAAHYCCGGITTDEYARTNINNLYAIGECADTGLHGANRLASNSLLECIVFAERASIDCLKNLTSTKNKKLPAWDNVGTTNSDEQVVITQNWEEIRKFMWNYVGIVRSNKRLERAMHRSNLIEKEIQEYYWNFRVTRDLIELRNLSLVARLVIKAAIQRKENRGLHYNEDFV